MTSFKTFLSSLNEDSNSLSLESEDDINRLKEECSDWIQATKDKYVFRGVRSTLPFVKSTINKNRQPKDASMFFTNLFNEAISRKFKVDNIRNISSFCTSSYAEAKTYGFTFYVFYPNGYQVLASRTVRDAYSYYDDAKYSIYDFLNNLQLKSFKNLCINDKEGSKQISEVEKFQVRSTDDLRNVLRSSFSSIDNNKIDEIINEAYNNISNKYEIIKSGNPLSKFRNVELHVFNVDYCYLISTSTYSEIIEQIYD